MYEDEELDYADVGQDMEEELLRAQQAKQAEQEFRAAFAKQRGPEIRATTRPAALPRAEKAPSVKQETRQFAAEVNATTTRGNSGGPGAKVRAKPPTPAEGVAIQKGDTMWALAKQHGVSLESLMAMNEGVDPRKLQVGQTLRLRPGSAPQDEVEQSEGPSLLAQKIAADRQRPAPTAQSVFRDVNLDNPYNGGLRDARDTAMAYTTGVIGAAIQPVGFGHVARSMALKPSHAARTINPRFQVGRR